MMINFGEGAQIFHARNASRCDHAEGAARHQVSERLEIGSIQHAVTCDRSRHYPTEWSSGVVVEQLLNGPVAEGQPTTTCGQKSPCGIDAVVEPEEHVVRIGPSQRTCEVRLFNRHRPENDAVNTGSEEP